MRAWTQTVDGRTPASSLAFGRGLQGVSDATFLLLRGGALRASLDSAQ